MEEAWSFSNFDSKVDNESLGAKLKSLIEYGIKGDLPNEVVAEHREWNKKFPDLTVVGSSLKLPKRINSEKAQLLNMITTRLVQHHLLPEMKRILEKNRNHPSSTVGKPRSQTFSLPRII
ncbi:unnamed protein product [Bursaphelenchus xylophilus]|uniref:(pine wood nematode) hypothetical protein n=1 Tax=Bursaphelenchus xylophilus TaxID=6326 RepID=A0A1I7S3F6_BURXY|nr:unnamed protein product [Bursaphelenchus xylophilus]CAG9116275.1 unnamed protein product [Bursaphelenchus xylophilus]